MTKIHYIFRHKWSHAELTLFAYDDESAKYLASNLGIDVDDWDMNIL